MSDLLSKTKAEKGALMTPSINHHSEKQHSTSHFIKLLGNCKIHKASKVIYLDNVKL